MARVFSLFVSSGSSPPGYSPLIAAFLCFFDFCSAFPSVAHRFLFAVLHFYSVPSGLQSFITCLFLEVLAFSPASGQNAFLFVVQSGVIQGDPLAGLLFALVLDPCLHLFHQVFELPGHGHIRACADDLGAVLKGLQGLGPLHEAFVLIRRATGLALNIPKCILIPLGRPFTPQLCENIRIWLYKHADGFGGIQLAIKGEYLGAMLGPGVGDE
eukprot:11708828-Karenia_brevis.AAC.1